MELLSGTLWTSTRTHDKHVLYKSLAQNKVTCVYFTIQCSLTFITMLKRFWIQSTIDLMRDFCDISSRLVLYTPLYMLTNVTATLPSPTHHWSITCCYNSVDTRVSVSLFPFRLSVWNYMGNFACLQNALYLTKALFVVNKALFG